MDNANQGNIKNVSISAFFPCFNEAQNVFTVINSAFSTLSKITSVWEIIIIDDGSTDNTADVLEELSTKIPNLRWVRHKNNLGYGAALKSGFLNCKYDLIFFSDGDGQFHLEELATFVQAIQDQAGIGIVAGYRQNRQDHPLRLGNAYLWNQLIRFLFRTSFKDVDCAFKLIKKEVIRAASPLMSDGAMISAELLIKAHKKGYKTFQIPVSHKKRLFGKSTGNNFKVICKAFLELAKLFVYLKNYG